MDNVYVMELIEPIYREKRIVGIFAAEGLAEKARDQAEENLTDDDLDRGVWFKITAYQLGKLYA